MSTSACRGARTRPSSTRQRRSPSGRRSMGIGAPSGARRVRETADLPHPGDLATAHSDSEVDADPGGPLSSVHFVEARGDDVRHSPVAILGDDAW
eukprot:2868516-Pyramimonas_sp.AAC.1